MDFSILGENNTFDSVVAVETEDRDTEAYLFQRNIVETCNKLLKGEPIEIKPGSDEHVVNIGPPSLYIIDVSIFYISLCLIILITQVVYAEKLSL